MTSPSVVPLKDIKKKTSMSTNSQANSNGVAMLTAMGFDLGDAVTALASCGGDVQVAVNRLLQGSDDRYAGTSAAPQMSPVTLQDPDSSSLDSLRINAVETIQGPISQYSSPVGHSACTCIALTAANKYLKSPATMSLTSDFLNDSVLEGIESYYRVKTMIGNDAEHTAAEQVLFAFDGIALDGDIRQGLLSYSYDQLSNMLQKCQHPSEYRCVIVTKTPETVLVCLPPQNAAPSTGNIVSYLLIDSHPRIHQFSVDQAYVRAHRSLSDLVQKSLRLIFPVTDLGPDIPELMAAMYNSFDIYCLKKGQSE